MAKTEDRIILSRICYSVLSLSWALLLGGCALQFIPSPPACTIPPALATLLPGPWIPQFVIPAPVQGPPSRDKETEVRETEVPGRSQHRTPQAQPGASVPGRKGILADKQVGESGGLGSHLDSVTF